MFRARSTALGAFLAGALATGLAVATPAIPPPTTTMSASRPIGDQRFWPERRERAAALAVLARAW